MKFSVDMCQFDWNQKFGNLMPLNRREVMYYHVQVNVWEDMEAVGKYDEGYACSRWQLH